MKIQLDSSQEELKIGFDSLRENFPEQFVSSFSFRPQHNPDFAEGESRLAVSASHAELQYGGKTGFYRGLGRVFGQGKHGELNDFHEKPKFKTIGVMIDLSRNAVFKVEELKRYVRTFALMGVNTIWMYMEDTYTVADEPLFGYMRGRYSPQELKDLDDYADAFGIEMIPCVQALGHMEQFLSWDSSRQYRDTKDILLIDDEDVYLLLGKMIDSLKACFRTNKIHIGMDEAHGVGTGEYQKKHGIVPPFDLLNRHLSKVNEICKSRGLNPIIWSDMYFRLGSKTGDYYDSNWEIPDRCIDDIPKNVQLVYWDYYSTDKDHYVEFIKHHRKLGSTPVVGSGIWSWMRFWSALPFSIKAIDACMEASKQEGIEEICVTIWGDDGAEVNFQSTLPAVQHFAEHAYADVIDTGLRDNNLLAITGINFSDYFTVTKIDTNDIFHDAKGAPSFVAKNLFWQDPMLPLLQPNTSGLNVVDVYEQISGEILALSKPSDASAHLELPGLIAKSIALKAKLYDEAKAAYLQGEHDKIPGLCDGVLLDLLGLFKRIQCLHRKTWFSQHKAFGWEVLDSRYGTLISRIETFDIRLRSWALKEVESIEEFDCPLELALPGPASEPHKYDRLKTASCIK